MGQAIDEGPPPFGGLVPHTDTSVRGLEGYVISLFPTRPPES